MYVLDDYFQKIKVCCKIRSKVWNSLSIILFFFTISSWKITYIFVDLNGSYVVVSFHRCAVYGQSELVERTETEAMKYKGCRCLSVFSIYFRRTYLVHMAIIASETLWKRNREEKNGCAALQNEIVNCELIVFMCAFGAVRYFLAFDVLTKRFNCSSSKKSAHCIKNCWCGNAMLKWLKYRGGWMLLFNVKWLVFFPVNMTSDCTFSHKTETK